MASRARSQRRTPLPPDLVEAILEGGSHLAGVGGSEQSVEACRSWEARFTLFRTILREQNANEISVAFRDLEDGSRRPA
jgi:hypothetical protein